MAAFFLSTAIIWLIVCLAGLASGADHYEILGVGRDAGDDVIRRAYRSKGKKYHPDKNIGNKTAKQKFMAVQKAYETLIDPELRQVYDRHGDEGVDRHTQTGGQPADNNPFNFPPWFFGGGGSRSGQGRGQNREAKIEIPLRDFYTGSVATFEIRKQVICLACRGTGSKDKVTHTCPACHGRRVIEKTIQVGPGMIQTIQTPCPTCRGSGKKLKNICPVCDGQAVVAEQEEHSITINPGMPSGATVTLHGEADESPGRIAGDLIIHVVESDPTRAEREDGTGASDGTFFRRRGPDLVWREVLGLREAWMGGWSRELSHLDGHIVRLGRSRGQVVQPGQVEIVKGEGMPEWAENGKSDKAGDLIVEYVVVLPDQMASGMEKDFWSMWQKWRAKDPVDFKTPRSTPADDDDGRDEL